MEVGVGQRDLGAREMQEGLPGGEPHRWTLALGSLDTPALEEATASTTAVSEPTLHPALGPTVVPSPLHLHFPPNPPTFLWGATQGSRLSSLADPAAPLAQATKPQRWLGGVQAVRPLTGCTQPSCPCSDSPGCTGSGGGSHPASEGEADVIVGTQCVFGWSSRGLEGTIPQLMRPSVAISRAAPSQPEPAGPSTFHMPGPSPQPCRARVHHTQPHPDRSQVLCRGKPTACRTCFPGSLRVDRSLESMKPASNGHVVGMPRGGILQNGHLGTAPGVALETRK